MMLTVLALLLAGCAGGGNGSKSADTSTQTTKPARETPKMRDRENAYGEGNMGLRDEVGQMFIVSIGGTGPDYHIEKMIRERNIGGVLLFGYNMSSEQQTKTLTSSLQGLSMKTDPAIPLFVATDQEGGEVSHAPWVTPEPAAAEVGRGGDPREARNIAREMGRQLLRAGVNTDLAPVVDTGFGAAIGDRSFGGDPKLVAEMGAASVEGFERAGVVSAAKHFPNHGPANIDSHLGLPVVDHDLKTVRTYDLPPFRAAIKAGVPMVMVGHLLYPAIDPDHPASLSSAAIRILRRDLGFDGIVVTDDLAMKGANDGGSPARAAVEAVKAGADMIVISSPPQQQADAYDAVLAAVRSGEIPSEQVRRSVERIRKVKEGYLFCEGVAK